MALSGQASGGWLESSSALRILHVGVRNTVGILTDDAFTQSNGPVVTYTATIANTSAGYNSSVLGVLSGSVAFARPDQGDNYIGGPVAPVGTSGVRPLGVFINTAAGNDFENQPAVASGKGPYVSAQGTYGNQLYETDNLNGGAALTYAAGDRLYASQNGYLTNVGDNDNTYEQGVALTAGGAAGIAAVVELQKTLVGVLKMPADSTQPEIVYDQRI
jgi:hypothetical protein